MSRLKLIPVLTIKKAGLTGLEPATSAVTGRCSNQLNYSPNFRAGYYRSENLGNLSNFFGLSLKLLRKCRYTRSRPALALVLSANQPENPKIRTLFIHLNQSRDPRRRPNCEKEN